MHSWPLVIFPNESVTLPMATPSNRPDWSSTTDDPNNAPDLAFGQGHQQPATDDGNSGSNAEEGKRGGRICAIVGAVLTVISIIVIFIAAGEGDAGFRGRNLPIWIVLAPGLVGWFGGIYGMLSKRAYEEENAYKKFIRFS